MRQALHAARTGAWIALVLAMQLDSTPAFAGPFSRLQVLLPGETAAPGTSAGRTGLPAPQTAGIPFHVTVRACDDTWALVPTVTHSIRILCTDASASLPAAAQLVGGAGDFLVILNAGGDFTIFAHDQSDGTIPDGASSLVRSMILQSLEFSSVARNQTAGASIPITITARDPNGNLVSGFSGSARLRELTSFGEGRISPSTVSLTAGQWSGSVTVYRADQTNPGNGSVSIAAEVTGHPAQSGVSNSFVVSPSAYRRLQIVAPGQSPAPGSLGGIGGVAASQAAGRSFTLQVYATDDYWNQVPSNDAVNVASATDPADTPMNGILAGGYRQFTFTFMTVGTQTLTVTNQSNPAIPGMTSDWVQVVPNAADGFAFAAIPSPQVVGVPLTIMIRATDSSGNTVYDYAGDAVLAANTGSGTSTPTLITFVGGVWNGPVTFFGAGASVRLTCTDFSSPPRQGNSMNITVNPASFKKLQVLLPGETAKGGTADGKDGTPSDQMAGAPFPITVRAVDEYWNVVSGIGHRIAFTSTDEFAGLPADTVLVSGQIVFPGRLFENGAQTITVHDVDDAGIEDNTSGAVNVVGGSFARILVLAPGQSPAPGTASGRTGAAIDQSINYAFTLTVLATDRWWNPVTGPTDVVHLTCGDPLAQVPADQPLVNGRLDVPVRLAAGGFQTFTVSDVTNSTMTGSSTQVRAISSGFHLEAAVTPPTARAGDPFTLTVRVVNDAGAPIQEINSSVTIEVQNATTRAPGRGTLSTPEFQLLGGERSITQTYTCSEPITLIAHDDAGNAPATSNAITITPGAPSAVRLATSPGWVGGNKHATVSARVVDAYENGVPAQSVSFTQVSGGGTLSVIDGTTDETGVARADYLSPRQPEKARIAAQSGTFTNEIQLETAFVDPGAPGGTIASYPNPFHPRETTATIAYKLNDNAHVSLNVYTLSGGLVLHKEFPTGTTGGQVGLNEFVWDGKNGRGEFVSSGGYLVIIDAKGVGETLHTMRRKIAVVQ